MIETPLLRRGGVLCSAVGRPSHNTYFVGMDLLMAKRILILLIILFTAGCAPYKSALNKYDNLPPPKAMATAYDSEYRWVAGYGYEAPSSSVAKRLALNKCEQMRSEYNIRSACTLTHSHGVNEGERPAKKIPPDVEKAAAELAMDKAISSGAEKYVADELNAAKKIWDTAETEMKEEKYKEAKQDYFAAKAAFDIIAANAEERKKMAIAGESKKLAVTAEANAAVAGLERDWKNLNAAAKNVEKKMKEEEMKEAWAADAEAFARGLKATKDKIATDPARVKADVVELRSIIQKWDVTFKKLAAAPSPSKYEATKKKAEAAGKKKKAKYSIQVKAYPETGKQAATEFVTKLKKIQPDVHMDTVYVEGRAWYRIFVGRFMTQEEASTYMKQKKILKEYPGSFVQSTSKEESRPEGDFGHIKPH